MEKGLMAFILGISLMITVPITIGLYAVKGSMDNISLGNVAESMNGITTNLQQLNNVLASVSEDDLNIIREVFYLMNKSLTGLPVIPSSIGVDTDIPIPTATDKPIFNTNNFRRI